MGIAGSALPEVATVGLISTGSVFAMSALARGRFYHTMFYYFLVQFLVLYMLGIPALPDADATFAYFVTWPIIAFAYSFFAFVLFYVMRLAEMLPFNRYFAGTCGLDLGPKPSTGFVVANFIVWLIVVAAAQFAYSWLALTTQWLALLLVILVPLFGHALAFFIHWMWLRSDAAAWGNKDVERTMLRSILVPGAFHLEINLVMGLIIYFAPDTYNYAWIGALINLGLLILVTVIVAWVVPNTSFAVPPRTGDLSTFAGIAGNGSRAAGPVYQAAKSSEEPQEQLEGTEETGSEDMAARFNQPLAYRARRTDATATLFNSAH